MSTFWLRFNRIFRKMSATAKKLGSKKRKVTHEGTEGSTFATEISESREALPDFKFNKKRVRVLSSVTDIPEWSKGVVYWMSRDQRVQDNWAFLYAQHLALKVESPLYVVFCIVPKFLDATIRHYRFMLKGLKEVSEECSSLNIEFSLLKGEAVTVLPAFLKENQLGAVVTDFSPLRVPMQWVKDMTDALPKDVPFCQVDAHNVVPCWVASDKQEYGARTIRPKIQGKLKEFLTEFPPLIKHPHSSSWKAKAIDWGKTETSLDLEKSADVEWAPPGFKAGITKLEEFMKQRLPNFFKWRNDPTKDALSNLSPWVHFGQISMQRCILEVSKLKTKHPDSVAAYVEEGVVRRELADNFCFYNPKYDSIEGAYDWAKTTLKIHAKDKRDYLYTSDEWEFSKTHDLLWNAAQFQMVREGKMHGFLRMYWAKKILEWSESPEEALRIAIYLNDKYELDGRDPNGYVGCMWSICGIHDQGWKERPVFGKIRYMNYNGCCRKFDVQGYISRCKKC